MNPTQPLWQLSLPWWHFVIRAAVVYLSILLMLRLAGKQQVGQMGMPHLVAILLISNAVQNAMNGGDNSITGGIILAAVLMLLSWLFSFLTFRSSQVEHLIQGRPTLLVHHGKILRKSLQREMMSDRELRTHLRRQGIHDLGEVEEAVLESDGYLSVVKKSDMEKEPAAYRRTDL